MIAKTLRSKITRLTFLLCGVLALHNASAATTRVINIIGDSFSPQVTNINVGDTVVWTNAANFHTVTGTGAEPLCGTGTVASCVHTFMTAGTFPYLCEIHAACCGMTGTIIVNAVATPPTVSITSPTNGAVFASPANVKITANATATGGTVTNVSFFSGTNSAGSAQSAPFTGVVTGLATGSYALTAVASSGGLSTTSAVVTVSVINPISISNSVPVIANGQFSFNYSANPGLTYVVQDSSNLTTWLSLVTNTPTSSPVSVSDTFNSNSVRYYRVGRLPNP